MSVTLHTENPSEFRMRNVQVFVGTLDMDASYPAGGESLDSISPGLDMVVVTGGTYVFLFDRATNKLKAMKLAGTTPNILLTEEGAVDLSAQTGLQYFAIKLNE